MEGRATPTIAGRGRSRAAKFTVEQKTKIADEAPGRSDPELPGDSCVEDSKGATINVAEGIDRRHVVSSDDMATHYVEVLNKKQLSAGEAAARAARLASRTHATPVATRRPRVEADQATPPSARYNKFFGYAKNIFLGDSRENSSIQEHLDTGHPEMAGKKLDDHVARIKRSWALD